jgi:rRNA-processing protein FCF1
MVGGISPLLSTLLVSQSKSVSIFRGLFKIGRDQFELPLAMVSNVQENSDKLLAVLNLVAANLKATDSKDAITVASMWIPQSQYWNDYLKDNIRPSDDIVEALRLMRDLRDKVTKLTKQNVNADWEVAVSRVLDQYLALHASLDMKELNDVMSSVNQCQITTKSIVEHIMKSIVAHCPVPSCKNDFVGIARVVHSGGPDFRIDFPSNLYTPEVIRSFIFDIGSQVPSIDLNGDNIFDEIILNLHKSLIDIDASIGSGGLSGLNSDEDYLAVVKSHDIGSMAQKVATLKELYEELVQLIGDVHISIEDSRLGDALSHVAALQPIIEKFTGTLKTGFQSVFVVDTNVLIKEPDLLKAFGHGELIVVAKRVIEELDDLKLKENQRVKASGISQEDSLLPSITRATRFLREFPVNRIQFCDGDMSLLSPDYRNKGDNLILSVAVKFKLYRPELLTNDNLLALKAQAEGISTLTSSEYLQRAQAKAKKSSAQSKSTPRPRAKESRQVEKASPPGRKL